MHTVVLRTVVLHTCLLECYFPWCKTQELLRRKGGSGEGGQRRGAGLQLSIHAVPGAEELRVRARDCGRAAETPGPQEQPDKPGAERRVIKFHIQRSARRRTVVLGEERKGRKAKRSHAL